MHSRDLTERAIALWRANGGPSGPIRSQACQVSGNNRVFVLSADNGCAVIAKHYFPDPAGGNSRLLAETAFCTYAAKVAAEKVPRLVACAPEQHLALHQYIPGSKLSAEQITAAHVAAAASFIRVLNDPAQIASAAALPPAAEASFSIAAHFAVVDRRLQRLTAVPAGSVVNEAACALLRQLSVYWTELKYTICRLASTQGLSLEDEISSTDRFVSPSDFGFHNVLMRDDGGLVFIDFEYAGWDDPAKLASDFFFQPAVPVDDAYYQSFIAGILGGRANAQSLAERISLLRPIFGVKWCCIMLNPFLPEMVARTRFADPSHDDTEIKVLRLQRAQNAFHKLTGTQWHT